VKAKILHLKTLLERDPLRTLICPTNEFEMNSVPPQTDPTTAPRSVDDLPPEALALASRFFDAARTGQMDILEQGLTRGLPANLTNDKGDTLVSTPRYERPWHLGFSQAFLALFRKDQSR
jgi:hypothetical protein